MAYRVAKEMEAKAKKDWSEIEEKRRAAREEYVANRKELYSKGIRSDLVVCRIASYFICVCRFNSTIRRIVHKKNRLTKDLGDDTKPRMRILVFYSILYDKNDVEISLQLRTDVEGTLEAILTVIESYNCQEECDFQVVDFNVGPPTSTDVELAKETGGSVEFLKFLIYAKFLRLRKQPFQKRKLSSQNGKRDKEREIVFRRKVYTSKLWEACSRS